DFRSQPEPAPLCRGALVAALLRGPARALAHRRAANRRLGAESRLLRRALPRLRWPPLPAHGALPAQRLDLLGQPAHEPPLLVALLRILVLCRFRRGRLHAPTARAEAAPPRGGPHCRV